LTSDRYARGFSDMAEVYVDLTVHARRLVEMASVEPGATVVDVGCGPGTAARVAAVDAGPDGRVVAVDLAPGMLARARHETRDTPIVHLAAMDARVLAIPTGVADVVLANSVVQFTGPGSLPEWRRIARPDGAGRVACSIPWGPGFWVELCQRYVDRTAEPFRSTMAQRLASAVRRPDPEAARARVGFRAVTSEVVNLVRRYASADEAFASEYQHGARVFLEELPPDALEAFRADYIEAVTTTDGSAELPFEFHFWCFTT
jgi:ubiquinone/menaquinone biosynthesis C-methylase UbiE